MKPRIAQIEGLDDKLKDLEQRIEHLESKEGLKERLEKLEQKVENLENKNA